MDESIAKVREAIAGTDWNDLWPRLLLFATKRCNRLFWRGQQGDPVPGGLEPGDIVLKVVEQALSGERRWNDKDSFYVFLCGSIASSLNHIAESAENRSTLRHDFTDETPFCADNTATAAHDVEEHVLQTFYAEPAAGRPISPPDLPPIYSIRECINPLR